MFFLYFMIFNNLYLFILILTQVTAGVTMYTPNLIIVQSIYCLIFYKFRLIGALA